MFDLAEKSGRNVMTIQLLILHADELLHAVVGTRMDRPMDAFGRAACEWGKAHEGNALVQLLRRMGDDYALLEVK